MTTARKARVPWIWIGGFVAIAFWAGVSVVAWMQGDLTGASMHLNDELQAARAAGLTVDASGIPRGPAVADGDNAAPLIVQATTQLRDFRRAVPGFGQQLDAAFRPGGPPGSWVALKPWLPKTDAIDLTLRKAAAKPDCNFYRKYELGPELMFPEISSMTSIERLLTARAWRAAQRGQVDDAFDELDTIARLSTHIGKAPDLVSWHSGVSAQTKTLYGLEQMLGMIPINRHVIERSHRLLALLTPPPNLRYVMGWDLTAFRIAIQNLRRPDYFPGYFDGADYDVLKAPLMRSPTALRALEMRVVSVHHRSFAELPQDADDWERSYDALRRIQATEAAARQRSRLISTSYVNSWATIVKSLGGWASYHRLAVTAVDLLEARLKTGHLPSSLPKSSNTIDPLTGYSFLYTPSEERLLIYSVGLDGQDNHGSRMSMAGQSEGYDTVFEVPLNRVGKP